MASLLHDSRQLNGGDLEPDLIQPRFNLTTLRPAKNGKQWPQGVSTEITRSAAYLCQLAACRASGEIGTEALAVNAGGGT